MRQRQRLGRASKKLLELEVEAEIAMVDRHPAHGCAGQRLRRSGQTAEQSRGTLGLERRIARQQLIGAVASQDDLDLLAREPAQQVRRQNRRVTERLVQPCGHFGQKFIGRLYRKRPLVMVRAQVSGDRACMAALVETGVLEADRKRSHVARRLDLAKCGRDARGIDPARQKDPDRHIRPAVACD